MTDTPRRLSRTKLALFLECPRCFHLDIVSDTKRIDSSPLRLHLAIDTLLKKEFDTYRLHERAHPIMERFGIEAVPLLHQDLDMWRDFRRGLSVFHAASGIELYGAVDDIWRHHDGTHSVVDYKATSAAPPVTFAGPNYDGYRRQLETYHWLLGHNGFPLNREDYWVIANAIADAPALDERLSFNLSVVPYEGDTSWVDDALMGMRECLEATNPPTSAKDCRWCRYRREAAAKES